MGFLILSLWLSTMLIVAAVKSMLMVFAIANALISINFVILWAIQWFINATTTTTTTTTVR